MFRDPILGFGVRRDIYNSYTDVSRCFKIWHEGLGQVGPLWYLYWCFEIQYEGSGPEGTSIVLALMFRDLIWGLASDGTFTKWRIQSWGQGGAPSDLMLTGKLGVQPSGVVWENVPLLPVGGGFGGRSPRKFFKSNLKWWLLEAFAWVKVWKAVSQELLGRIWQTRPCWKALEELYNLISVPTRGGARAPHAPPPKSATVYSSCTDVSKSDYEGSGSDETFTVAVLMFQDQIRGDLYKQVNSKIYESLT